MLGRQHTAHSEGSQRSCSRQEDARLSDGNAVCHLAAEGEQVSLSLTAVATVRQTPITAPHI